MATQDIGGLLFGQGGSGLEEYLTPAQVQQMQQQGMMSAAAALLSASGERPVGQGIGLGQALGGALQAGQQGYQTAQQGAIANLMAQQKLREAKIDADIKAKMAAEQSGEQPVGLSADDAKFNTYMKYSDIYARSGKLKEAKDLQDLAYQIKPRAEVTGAPFEVTGADNKPLLVQQMKDGSIKTVEGYGPKRDVVLQNLGGRTVAIDKSKLTGGESFTQTLAPQVVGGAETGYYVVGGGGGAAPAPAGGQRTATTPPVGSTIMRPDYRPAPSAPAAAPAPSVLQPRATGLQPIIAGTGTKPQEAFMKSTKQLNDLQGALKDYKDELKKDITVFPTNIAVPFTDSGIPLPTGADTARMSGKYNSLLMGVKNLYELGALAGPDMAIIERQFTNPASLAGAFTSRKAMDEQVKVLEDMLARAKENLSTSYRQTVPAAAAVTELVWDPVQQKAVPKNN